MLRSDTRERHPRGKSKAIAFSIVPLTLLLAGTTIVWLPFRQEGWIVAGHRVFSQIDQEMALVAELTPPGLSTYQGTRQITWLDEHVKSSGAPDYYNFRVGRWIYTLSIFKVRPMTPAEIERAETYIAITVE